jgi:hypothetical protein
MLAIAVLSLPTIAIVAAAPIAARERAQGYEQRHARCASKYACEHRNAGQDYFTNFNECRSLCRTICRHEMMRA